MEMSSKWPYVCVQIRQELPLGQRIWDSLTYKWQQKSWEDRNRKLRREEKRNKNIISDNI